MARDYELTLIVDSQQGEEGVGQTVDQYKTYLTENGVTDIGVDRRGVRKLAYEVKKHAQADFTFMQFAVEPDVLSEMDRQLGLDQNVLRHLFARIDAVELPEEEESEAEETAVAETAEEAS